MKTLTKRTCLVALLGFMAFSARATTLTNWARGGIATQSTTYPGAVASRGIDGNTAGAWGDNTTTHTADSENVSGGQPWWQVDLKETQTIGHVQLWFREDCCFTRNENLRIVIYDSTNTATRVVLWETNNTAWTGMVPRDLGFDVDPAVNGRVVYVEHTPDQAANIYVCLTELEVFNQKLAAPNNHALASNSGAAASSSCYLSDCTLYGPEQAIDGSHHGLTSVSPWAYSAPDNSTPEVDPLPWWQVDLAAPQTIGSVVIWPRRDRTLTRFLNIQLTVSNGTPASIYQQKFVLQPAGPKYVVNFVPALTGGKTVRIETTADTPDKFLNLPEVEVFAPLAAAPAITFVTNLQPVTVEQNRVAILGPVAVTVDGGIRPEDISYRWYLNGVELPNMAGSWLNPYTTPALVGLGNSGDKYKVQVSVSGYGVFSSEVALSVYADTNAPVVVTNYASISDAFYMNLVFSELLDPATATNAANYSLDGGPTVGTVTLNADGKSIRLSVLGLLPGDSVALHASGVKDLVGNIMVPALFNAPYPSAEVNYALIGAASQSSDTGGAASRCIDGNTSGSWGSGSINHTGNGDNEWWEVDLKSPRPIGIVRVWIRTDCCTDRAENLDLVIYDDTNTVSRVEVARIHLTTAGPPPNPIIANLGAGLLGRVVRIEHPTGIAQYLNLSEVQVIPPPTGLQITSSPRSWAINEGDRAVLRGAALGSPPITYQWQRNNVDVPGATNANLTIPAIAIGQAGNYTLVASNLVRVRTSNPATVAVNPRPSLGSSVIARYSSDADTGTNLVDTAPMNPAKTVMHDGVNYGAIWTATVESRNGVLQFDGVTSPFSGLEIPAHSDFDGPNTNGPLTVAFWIKSPACDSNPGNSGACLFDRQSAAQGYGGFTIQAYDESGGGGPNVISHNVTGGYARGTNMVGDDVWHHVVLMYGQVPYSLGTVYLDGQLDTDALFDLPGQWQSTRNLFFGRSWDGWWKRFNGYMDDIHIFNRLLNAAEVAQVMAGLTLPPPLHYSVADRQLTLTWSDAGYILQQNANLSNAAGWADIAGATTGTQTVTMPATDNNFYRLRKQ